MSLPDWLLEDDRPDDEDYCEIHTMRLKPCPLCRQEAAIEKAEERYKHESD